MWTSPRSLKDRDGASLSARHEYLYLHSKGKIRAELESKGEMIGDNDLWGHRARGRSAAGFGYQQREGVPGGARTEGAKLGCVAVSIAGRSGKPTVP
jgi:hypothetical protein